MSDAMPMSRIAEYKNHAALRRLVLQTRYPEIKAPLFALADSFDKLAERVEARETAVANIA